MDQAAHSSRSPRSTHAERRSGPTVRATILAAVLALTAIALATAGVTAAFLQDQRVTARINADLATAVADVRALAESGVDPSTNAPLASSSEIIRTGISRIVPGRNEGIVGIVNDRVQYTSSGAPIALQDDAELLNELRPILADGDPQYATITTSITRYRVAVVPLISTVEDAVQGSNSGVTGIVIGFDLRAELSEFREVFTTYAIVAVVSLIVVGIVGWLIAGHLLRPVRTLAETARQIGREDLSERIPVAGNDDLSHMTSAVNEMLERLDQAFAAQRELVGDVSHELRTPLTVVRGHLELMDPDDAADTRAVQTLVLDEVARMNRVVDDLTTLASIDQPGFLHIGGVQAGQLTDEVFDKSVAFGPREWTIDARAEALVHADAQRLTQAWLQLVANAVKFSEPGSRIALASRVRDGDLMLSVQDEGVGIDGDDLGRIFDRFERAGDRSTRGSGLGLPIVRAIAEAHGGAVAVDSEPGVGSTFTIRIPLIMGESKEH